MTIFARRTSPAANRRHLSISLKTLSSLVLALSACLALSSPADAVITKVETTTVGLQPRTGVILEGGLAKGEPESLANNEGNVILGDSSVYAIYWDPTDVFFKQHHEWLTKLDTFFQQMGAGSGGLGNILSTLGQYRDRANTEASYNTVFKVAYTDSTKYPGAGCTDPKPLVKGSLTCLTDAQVREQLQSFIAAHNLPRGMNTIYYVFTPPGATVCLDAAATHCSDYSLSTEEAVNEEHKSTSYKNSFCSYHSDINPDNAVEGDGSTILYAAVPWSAAGTLGDPYQYSSALAYEQGYPCQDGGWDPEKGREVAESPKEPSKEEEEILAGTKGNAEEKAELQKRRRLEGAHQQEPNQEGLGEDGGYSPGLADLIINQVAEEQADIVTDPLLNAWHDSEGREVTDQCRDFFGSTVAAAGGHGEIGGSVKAEEFTEAGTLFNTSFGTSENEGHYYVNNVFSLSDGGCVGGVGLVPRFTSPNPVNVNESVGFDGMESTVGLLEAKAFGPSGPPTPTYATFTWNFGDGTETTGFAPNSAPCEAPWLSPCAGSVLHSYQYGGAYEVTLTIRDVAGDVTSVTHTVTVNGPAKPGSSPEGGGGTPGSNSSGQTAQTPGTTGSTSGTTGPSGVPSPIATATILPQKLKTALHKGLVVSYSVNEQVAGHFEVLLAASTAHRLGIGGAPATGLPAGSPRELVIAKAILVTTKGGHSAIHIKFSKKTAARLAHAHKVPLMLRLVVRNASSSSPASTTVVSNITLAG